MLSRGQLGITRITAMDSYSGDYVEGIELVYPNWRKRAVFSESDS